MRGNHDIDAGCYLDTRWPLSLSTVPQEDASLGFLLFQILQIAIIKLMVVYKKTVLLIELVISMLCNDFEFLNIDTLCGFWWTERDQSHDESSVQNMWK